MVPGEGIEPTWCCHRRILSPLRLPVPPSRLVAARLRVHYNGAAMNLSIDDFEYELPSRLIAQHPSQARSASRLLPGGAGTVADHHFSQLPGTLAPGAADERRYQPVSARSPGAVAAPPAGLHFDEPLLAALAQRGVEFAYVTLHVGAGTFQPVRAKDLAEHRMHGERYEIPAATAAALERIHKRGGKIVAVGTTTVRCLQGSAPADGIPVAGAARTDPFITPRLELRRS